MTPASRRSRFHRVLGVTVLFGLSLVLIVGVVFAIAYGSRNITSTATDLHKVDESLRSATIARAQLALAGYMAAVDDRFGTVTIDQRGMGATNTDCRNPSRRSSIIEMVAKMAVNNRISTSVPGK